MSPQSSSARRVSLEWATVWAFVITLIVAIAIVVPGTSLPYGPTKAFVLAAGTLITLACYVLARLSRGNFILPPMLLVGALWFPTIAYALSTLFSGGSFANAFWGVSLPNDSLGFMLTVSMLATLAAFTVRRPDQYRAFFKIAAWVAAIVIGVKVVALILGQFIPNVISPGYAIIGSGKDLAILLGLVVTVALITLRALEITPATRVRLLVLTGFSIVLLATLNYQIVWILVALVSLGLFVEAIMKRRTTALAEFELDDTEVVAEVSVDANEGPRAFIWPLVVLAISIFFLISGTLANALVSALHVGVVDVRPSWQSTLSVGDKVYSASPIFGAGPGNFGVEWLKYRNPSLNTTQFWNLNFTSGIGFIPTSFVTTGLLGALAWLGLFGLLLFLGGRMLIMRAPQDPYVRYTAFVSFVSAIFLFTVAIFDLPGSVILALAFVMVGVFASTMRFAGNNGQWGLVFAKAPRLGFVIVFALTLLLLGSVGAGYALIEQYVSVAELSAASTALAAGNLDTADTAAGKAISFAPTASAYEIQAASASARLNQIAASSTMSAADAQKAFQSSLSNGINAALAATALSPTDYQAWVALGNLYALAVPLGVQGAYDSAKAAYNKALALDPSDPQLYYLLGQIDVANKDTASAEADLKKAIALKQDYTPAIFLLSEIYVQDGNVKDALAAAEAAVYFTPNDPSALFQMGVLAAASGDLKTAEQALLAAVTANANFANARYFLAAVYAKQGDYQNALAQIKAVGAMSSDNAAAVAPLVTALEGGKDPFPANLLTISAPQTSSQTSSSPEVTSTPSSVTPASPTAEVTQ